MDCCEGCPAHTFDKYNVAECYGYEHNSEGECPCSNCIVKPMCHITCDQFVNFVDNKREDT